MRLYKVREPTNKLRNDIAYDGFSGVRYARRQEARAIERFKPSPDLLRTC